MATQQQQKSPGEPQQPTAVDYLARIYETEKRQLHLLNVISGYLAAFWWVLIVGVGIWVLAAIAWVIGQIR
jgi:hypothetical protein